MKKKPWALSLLILCALNVFSSQAYALNGRGSVALTRKATATRNERAKPLRTILQAVTQRRGQANEAIRDLVGNPEERAAVLFNQESPVSESVKTSRMLLASLFKREATRDLTVSEMKSQLSRLSEVAEEYLRINKAATVEELVIGAGPQSAAYLQEKTTADPDRTVMVVDCAKNAGGTFANVGSAFAINSTSRKYEGERARPGRGDLNNMHEIVGIPDFRAGRWPDAGTVGDVATVGVYMSSAIPMFETEVLSIEKQKSGPRYSVQVRKNGNVYLIRTNTVVIASGLGIPVNPFKDANTRRLVDFEGAKENGRVESFTDFINRVGDRNNSTPIRDLVDKTVAVVGAGDSGRVVNELLTGLGPEAAYKADVAQVGQVQRIIWFTGIEGFKNCEEFLAKSRARYSRLAQAINSGILIPVPGRLTKIVDDGRRLALGYETKDGPVKPGIVTYIRPADARIGLTAQEVTEIDVKVDKVIYATGFKSTLAGFFETFDRPFEDAWTLVKAKGAAFDGKQVAIARQRKDARGIYLIGPANEEFGGLPSPSELKGINENTVSLFANVARTQELARKTGNADALSSARSNRALDQYVRTRFQQQLATGTVKFAPANSETLTLSFGSTVTEQSNSVRRIDDYTLALEVLLRKHLKGLKHELTASGALPQTSLKMRLSNSPQSTDTFELVLENVNLDAALKVSLETSLSQDPVAASVIQRDLFGYFSNGIDIEIPLSKSGRLDFKYARVAR